MVTDRAQHLEKTVPLVCEDAFETTCECQPPEASIAHKPTVVPLTLLPFQLDTTMPDQLENPRLIAPCGAIP